MRRSTDIKSQRDVLVCKQGSIMSRSEVGPGRGEDEDEEEDCGHLVPRRYE